MRAAMMVLLLSTFWATATVPAEPPAPPDVAMLVSGVIHDALGLPLAEVEIACWWLEESMLTGATLTQSAGVVHTDKDGRFLWMGPFPDGTPTPENPMAPHNRRRGFIVTRHPDCGITMTPWHRLDAGLFRGAEVMKDIPAELLPPRTAEPLKLPQGAAASGTVRDAQGDPVAGATVTASLAIPYRTRKPIPPPGFYDPNPPPDSVTLPQRLDGILQTTTATDGTFRLGGLPKKEAIALHVYHPEMGEATLGATTGAPGGQPFTFMPDEDQAEVELPGAGSLLGQVILAENETMPKEARVRMTRQTPFAEVVRDAMVDAEGRYAVPALAPGMYRLLLVAPPLHANVVDVTIESGVAVEAPRMVAGPGAFLAGSFVDATSGAVIQDVAPQISVEIEHGGIEVLYPDYTGGRFEITTRPGIVALHATTALGEVFPEDTPKQLVLKHGTRNESLSFRYTPPRHAVGRVVLPDGTPASGAYVSLGGADWATTDRDGSFSLPCAPFVFGNAESVVTAVYGKALGLLGVGKLGTGTQVRITVNQPASITGTLVDPLQKPIPGRLSHVMQMGGAGHGTRTNLRGEFTHTGLLPGQAVLLRQGRGYVELKPPLEPGEQRALGQIIIDPAQPVDPVAMPIDIGSPWFNSEKQS